MAKAKAKTKDKPKDKPKSKGKDKPILGEPPRKPIITLARSFSDPFIRILQVNGATSTIEPHLVANGIDCPVRISVSPATLPTGLTVTLTDVNTGTETAPTVTAVGSSNKVHLITIPASSLTSASQFILRIQIGTTNTVAEITLQT